MSTNDNTNDNKFHFCIDRGGTFTDVHCILPSGEHVVRKLLSEDPSHYPDAPTEGIRRLLSEYSSTKQYPPNQIIDTSEIGSVRMGTTVATNALLERKGAPMALLITKGFRDLLEIGNQSRPDIFDLTCAKPSLLYKQVLEVDERIVLEQYYPQQQQESLKTEKGLTGESIIVLQEPNLEEIRKDLVRLREEEGITALAVCLMHSYVYPEHELRIGEIAKEVGFEQISLSSQVMPMVRLVSR